MLKNGLRRKDDCSNDACICTCTRARMIEYLHLCQRQHLGCSKATALSSSSLSSSSWLCTTANKAQASKRTIYFDGINQASIINSNLYRPIKMSKHHEGRVNKEHKVLVADINVSSKVSKLFYFCGCFFVLWYCGWISNSFVAADIHTYGPSDFKGEVILNRRIFIRNTTVPTNYTVLYKYVLNKLAGVVSYVEFNVANCVSTGTVELLLGEGVRQDTVVTVNLHVMNCEHLHINGRILGTEASVATQLAFDPFRAEIYGDKLFEPKSFALIYAHNETRSMDRFFKIGQRQTNDTVLMFDEIIVKNELSPFPQYEIEYNEPNVFITQIEFQFDSPTATAFLNSSFIQPHSFNAIVYDLNRPQFTVNFNVYGYRASDKPSQYKSILTF
ncbi:uncharacterized protein LOC129577743 [Sitodiplosis mosellana]|uniref:uncharacterized protein LOC129577743 n=1 Tax=Sitodiplosis mosellana TaxID=263140 RepID=UPI002444F96C|nr:uncharacterized protein LOC129577743 [Sitodiplosis mosellana]